MATIDSGERKQIECPACGGMFVPADLTRLNVEGHRGLENVGLSCPYCNWFGHCFIEDMRIRRRRATVAVRRADWGRHRTRGKFSQVEKAQADLARVFDEAQAKWRPVLGLTPVWDVDIRDVDMK